MDLDRIVDVAVWVERKNRRYVVMLCIGGFDDHDEAVEVGRQLLDDYQSVTLH